MLDVFGYIFSNLETAERAIRSQSRINRNIAICGMAIAAYAIIQSRKIRDLEKEIKELKHQRGE